MSSVLRSSQGCDCKIPVRTLKKKIKVISQLDKRASEILNNIASQAAQSRERPVLKITVRMTFVKRCIKSIHIFEGSCISLRLLGLEETESLQVKKKPLDSQISIGS